MEAATNGSPSATSSQNTATVSTGTAVVSENATGWRPDNPGIVSGDASKQSQSPRTPSGVSSGNPSNEKGAAPAIPQETADPNVWTIKVSGQERKFDLRKPDEAAYLKRQLAKVEGADKAFEEGALSKKKAQQFFEALKTNPRGVLEAMGYNVPDLAKQVLAEELKFAQMDERDRAIYERDQKLQAYQVEEQKRAALQQEQIAKEAENKYRQKFDIEITNALAQSNLPKTDYTVQRIAKYLLEAKQRGYRDATAADVIDTVQKDYMRDFQAMFQGQSVDKLQELVGKDFFDKLRNHDIGQIKDPAREQFVKKPNGSAELRSNAVGKKYSWEEYQKILDSRIKD